MRLLPILLFLIVAVVLLLPLLRRIPVCQTYVVKSRAVRRADAGRVRYFCSEQCARLDTGG